MIKRIVAGILAGLAGFLAGKPHLTLTIGLAGYVLADTEGRGLDGINPYLAGFLVTLSILYSLRLYLGW